VGPSIATAKYRRLSAYGVALIPVTGSAINRCVSYYKQWFDENYEQHKRNSIN